jgi:hypothetical protein
MRSTVRKMATDASATCVGSCDWRRAYVGPRAARSATEAATRHRDRADHSVVVEANFENVYSTWPSKSDIRAWGLAEFEE